MFWKFWEIEELKGMKFLFFAAKTFFIKTNL
jgi:hypothetical protein